YSAAVISPASGNIAVNGSAAQRTKNAGKLSTGGPESAPLLLHSIQVSGTNTAAPSTSPGRQTFKPVTGRHKESRNRQGRKTNIVVPYDTMQPKASTSRNSNTGRSPSRVLTSAALSITGTSNGARITPVQLNRIASCSPGRSVRRR